LLPGRQEQTAQVDELVLAPDAPEQWQLGSCSAELRVALRSAQQAQVLSALSQERQVQPPRGLC
jgi:hypothetical protein